ncbi:MAG: hypothetical protein GY754_37735 [bacterium]|nr:hypothetical protein [bacterium]
MNKYFPKFKPVFAFLICLVVAASTSLHAHPSFELLEKIINLDDKKSDSLLAAQLNTDLLAKYYDNFSKVNTVDQPFFTSMEKQLNQYENNNTRNVISKFNKQFYPLKTVLLYNVDMWPLISGTAGTFFLMGFESNRAYNYKFYYFTRRCTFEDMAWYLRKIKPPIKPNNVTLVDYEKEIDKMRDDIDEMDIKQKWANTFYTKAQLVVMAVGSVLRAFDLLPTFKTDNDVVVFRGIYEFPNKVLKTDHLQVNELVVENSFFHTSLSALYACKFREKEEHAGGLKTGVLKMVFAVESKYGKYIGYSKPGNFEVTFLPGTVFRVKKTTTIKLNSTSNSKNKNKKSESVLLVLLEDLGNAGNLAGSDLNDGGGGDDDQKEDSKIEIEKNKIIDIFSGLPVKWSDLVENNKRLQAWKAFSPFTESSDYLPKEFTNPNKKGAVIPAFGMWGSKY